MRTLILVCVVAGIAWPAFAAAQQITVEQLKEKLASSRAEADEQLASQISEMQLTERPSSQLLVRMKAGLPGDKSRQALIALADVSGFLDVPSAEIPAEAAPDRDRQRQIAAMVVNYATRMNHQLPNFFATRTTTRFEDWPKDLEVKGTVPIRYIPPRMVGKSHSIVTYRNGKEEVSDGAATPGRSATNEKKKPATNEQGLYVRGLFGPILATVLVDASRGTLAWSHWEKGESTKLAVFRYAVPMEKSNYEVKFCCVPVWGIILSLLNRISAYHGEIAVDPDTGTIVRLTLLADLDQGADLATLIVEAGAGTPLSRADILVEYGPVEIGSKTYFCPTRSVAVSRARTLLTARSGKAPTLGPAKIFVNDVSFTQYHVFRSESRILMDASQ
jgi:hypothetical protein